MTGTSIEITAVRADGCELPVEFSITQISDAEPPLFTSFFHDLSERERIARQLHDKLEQFLEARSVPSQAPESMLHTSSASGHVAPSVTLTVREREVLAWIGQGVVSNRELTERLGVSESTVRFHISSILRKLRLNKRSQLVAYAIRHGLVTSPEHSG